MQDGFNSFRLGDMSPSLSLAFLKFDYGMLGWSFLDFSVVQASCSSFESVG